MAQELSYLLAELQNCEDVSEAKLGIVSGVICFNATSGCYSTLTSQIVTILGRYDADLTIIPSESGYDFYLTSGAQ